MRVRVGDRPAAPVDTSPGEAGASPETASAERRSTLATAAIAVGVFLLIAAVLFVVARLSLSHLPYTKSHARPDILGDRLWFNGWFRWDGGWYENIAHRGYYEPHPGAQSPAAYFPAYPALMRIGAILLGTRAMGGIAVTFLSGLIVAALFAVWLRDRVEPRARWTALLLFLLYPFAFYLYGAVYADALFIAAVLAAFLLIERDLPWLAGLAGAVATAARPVGAALLLPLIVRLVERRGGLRQVRWRDAGILLAGAGVGAFCLLCWRRYGTPLAWMEAQEGWNQEPGLATWLKTEFIQDLKMFAKTKRDLVTYLSHPVLTVAALALVPRVVRRFGWGYGSYVLVVVGLSALSTQNFFGMSRYVLAAFPCFAVAGELLARRPRVRAITLAASSLLLMVATSLFARGFYLS